MNRLFAFLLIQALLFTLTPVFAQDVQDTLPKFSVKNVGNNRIIIGWVNNYPLVKTDQYSKLTRQHK